MKNYRKLVPDDSFMGRYLAYMERQETAHAFDWWCGLWCIAAACGRRCYVARPRAPVYLNMYLVLIGESGIVRKTTSVTFAGMLARRIANHDGVMGYLGAKVTAEKLDELMHNRTSEFGSAQLCIAMPELAVFLGTERYVANMPTVLTDLYDCPSHRHGGGTIARGECIQRDVWISFLSASTPMWLLKTVNPNVIEGGFSSRCLFVVSNHPKRKIPWPEEDNGYDAQEQLFDDLKYVHDESMARGAIALTDGALSAFKNWYNKRSRSLDTYKQSFEAREDAHILRTAALMCINDGSWRIDHAHVSRAVSLIAELKENSAGIFVGAETRTKFATSLDSLRSMLISAGMDPIPRHKLYLRCRHTLDNSEFLALLDVLHEMGAIQRYEVKTQGRPTDYIRGTQLLLARGLGDDVLDRIT